METLRFVFGIHARIVQLSYTVMLADMGGREAEME
jgi:hypothetical protein